MARLLERTCDLKQAARVLDLVYNVTDCALLAVMAEGPMPLPALDAVSAELAIYAELGDEIEAASLLSAPSPRAFS